MLDSGEGVDRSGSTGGHSADTRRAVRENCLRLQQDLECELYRAPALEQADRLVEVDVMARRENDRRFGVVPRSLEGLVTPVLDSVALLIGMAAVGVLPVGPSVGAASAVIIFGTDAGAAAAAGALLTATAAVAALVFAATALLGTLRRSPAPAPATI